MKYSFIIVGKCMEDFWVHDPGNHCFTASFLESESGSVFREWMHGYEDGGLIRDSKQGSGQVIRGFQLPPALLPLRGHLWASRRGEDMHKRRPRPWG